MITTSSARLNFLSLRRDSALLIDPPNCKVPMSSSSRLGGKKGFVPGKKWADLEAE